MSHQGNLLERVIRRQVRFQQALKERVKDEKIKAEQIETLKLKGKKRQKVTKPENGLM